MAKKTIIEKIQARVVFDSRGVATIEVDVITSSGFGRNAAPFGAPGSRGEFEASAYGTVGIEGVVKVVEKDLAKGLIGMDASDLRACDSKIREIDGTANFSRIGGNTSSALSIAIARAAANSLNIPIYKLVVPDAKSYNIPVPLGNIIGGGAHAMGPTPDMQEHLAIPVSARSVKEAVQLNILLHEAAGDILEKMDPDFVGGTDDEHAWTANMDDTRAFEVVAEACQTLKTKMGAEFRLGLDLAADRLWNPAKKQYIYTREGKSRTTAEQVDFVESLVKKFNMLYVEDAFNSNDYQGFAELRKRVGKRCLVCGDDLLATNRERTAEGVKQGSMSSMIIKVNQIGTVSDAQDTTLFSQSKGIKTIISHRSGETDDNTLAHLGVAWNCIMVKTGVTGGERLAKLNELIRIEEALGKKATISKVEP
jgi:enolase